MTLIIKKLEKNFEMIPIVRSAEELFSTTVVRECTNSGLSFITNANFYNLTKAGYLDVMTGHDPVAATETIPEGWVISNKVRVTGDDQPLNFYIAFNKSLMTKDGTGILKAFSSGQGNPPTDVYAAFGGLGPLIINGLPYGVINKYKAEVPNGAPEIGEPDASFKSYLIQRSNAKYTAFAKKDSYNKIGKMCIGVNAENMLVIVQADGSESGWSLDTVRDYYIKQKCKHAVFFDGSDSVLLYEPSKGGFRISQGENKDESCIVGIGFKQYPVKP